MAPRPGRAARSHPPQVQSPTPGQPLSPARLPTGKHHEGQSRGDGAGALGYGDYWTGPSPLVPLVSEGKGETGAHGLSQEGTLPRGVIRHPRPTPHPALGPAAVSVSWHPGKRSNTHMAFHSSEAESSTTCCPGTQELAAAVACPPSSQQTPYPCMPTIP